MGMSIEFIVEKFLQSYSKPFTRSEFSAMMKGLRLVSSDKEANALLDSFDCIYKISDDYYVTRSGAFLDYYFSFQPTKEEIENGVFLIGDRCIPFIDSEYEISFLNFCFDGQKLNKKAVEFDSDFVLNFYSLYGDEYASQVIASDVVNRDVELSKSGYELPSKVKVTCIDIEPFIRDGRFSFGDRIVCRVMDFLSGTISIEFLKQNFSISFLISLGVSQITTPSYFGISAVIASKPSETFIMRVILYLSRRLLIFSTSILAGCSSPYIIITFLAGYSARNIFPLTNAHRAITTA